jgi:hypothetical protein
MTEILKHYLHYSFHSLTKYDYMAIGWILFLGFLLIVLALFLKKRALSYSLLFIGLFLLFFGAPVIKYAMDRYMRPAEIAVTKVKPLRYSHSLIVEGSVHNIGKIDYSACDLILSIYRPRTALKELAALLRPMRVQIDHLSTPLERDASKPFRIIVDHFNNGIDFNVSVQAR